MPRREPMPCKQAHKRICSWRGSRQCGDPWGSPLPRSCDHERMEVNVRV